MCVLVTCGEPQRLAIRQHVGLLHFGGVGLREFQLGLVVARHVAKGEEEKERRRGKMVNLIFIKRTTAN